MLLELSIFIVVQVDRQQPLKYRRLDKCEHMSKYTPMAYYQQPRPTARDALDCAPNPQLSSQARRASSERLNELTLTACYVPE